MRRPQHLKIKIAVTFIYLGILALAWFTTGFPCPFKLIFGAPCPFCGMTRAFVSLLKLDLATAFSYHGMVWSLPVLYLLFLFDGRIFKKQLLNTVILSVVSAGFLINWIFHLMS